MASDVGDDYPGWIAKLAVQRFAYPSHMAVNCVVCDLPPSVELGTEVFHASPDVPGLAMDVRVVFVTVATGSMTPLPICRDCTRALILRALDLGF